MSKTVISVQDIEFIRMHVWEMRKLVDKMREEKNPETDRLDRLLTRFQKADPNLDRA